LIQNSFFKAEWPRSVNGPEQTHERSLPLRLSPRRSLFERAVKKTSLADARLRSERQ
jgi:hypothetical protein